MIELFSKVPNVVWAALGGSALTVLGVFLQNIWESRRLKQKLDHEAEQRRLDRQIQLRREIYLEAADSAVKAQRILGVIARPDRGLQEIVGEFDTSLDIAGLSKVHLVGKLATIRAFQDLGLSLSEQMLDLIRARIEFENAKAALTALDDRVAQAVAY
jgi:heme exporter protein D